MSTPTPDPHLHNKPTPEDLAGTPVSQEEDNPTIRVRDAQGAKVRTSRAVRVRGTPQRPLLLKGPPTADDLAGIPVSVEGNEIQTVRPRKPRKQP